MSASKFTELPKWTFGGQNPGAITFISAIALAGLEDEYIRLSAETQKVVLGFNVFGKKEVKVDRKTQRVTVRKKVCFGTDALTASFDATELRDALKEKKQVTL